jgi:hypothetical protein
MSIKATSIAPLGYSVSRSPLWEATIQSHSTGPALGFPRASPCYSRPGDPAIRAPAGFPRSQRVRQGKGIAPCEVQQQSYFAEIAIAPTCPS